MTKAEFYDKWQEQHLPCMDTQNDNGFYYQTYLKLKEVIGFQEKGVIMVEHLLFDLLLFLEDEAGLGLTRTYRKGYKSAKDIPGILLRQRNVNEKISNAVCAIIEEVIEVAPKSNVPEVIRLSLIEKKMLSSSQI